ncbi:uncharacterized protein F4807DRAFT_223829 [Annulohypoxylon truncatum]|uniref:uncharacterized protein n=1 Tax=Annulohypoxylon truncatum TaxID=327061 RepID=UPI002007F51B|nr:uncharacterized protein F4807DRAFT_223829 [Annulohypoxylon truncatum]KAI1206540.1 hypothetical protein F4807DRAFT_223829 [Annulohypoxylon truncatum]
MATDDPSDNPFIRFRKHIDTNIQRGFHTVFGSSTATVTKTNNNMSTDNSKSENSTPYSEMPDHDKRSASTSASTSADDVLSWAVSSPYSPANLQSLPQPRPNDAPRDYPDCFTFRDSFEDLLRASDQRPLSDLRRLVFAKQFEHFKYSPWGMPVEDWVNSIGRRGLWDTYFPLSSSAKRELSYGLVSPWIFQTQEKTFNQPHIFTWSSVTFPRWEYHFPRSDHDWTGYSEPPSKHEVETAQYQEADTEEALYTNTPSKFTTSSRAGTDVSRAEPVNTKLGLTWEPDSSDSSDSATAPVSQTIETPDGGKILKTVQQRTHGGGTKTTTTTRQFDADGNLIAQGEETSWSWSRTFPNTASSFNEGKAGSSAEATTSSSVGGEASIRGSGKVNGWFWTR